MRSGLDSNRTPASAVTDRSRRRAALAMAGAWLKKNDTKATAPETRAPDHM